MFKQLKTSSDELVGKIARQFPRFSPNFITILGVIPPLAFLWLLINHFYGWAIFALILTAIDSLDGAYARATNQVSAFGAVLDASLDRFSDAIIISAFSFAGLCSWPLAISLVIASFMISYIKASGGAHGLNEKSLGKGPIERVQRLVLVGIALLCYILMPYGRVGNLAVLNSIFVLLLLLSIVTILRRYRAVYRSN